MHELSLASELIARCLEVAAGRPVAAVRVRLAPGTDVDALRQGFGAAAADTAVEGARLDVEAASVALACPCGYEGELGPDDVAGHVAVCPACGTVSDVSDTLELVSVHVLD
jgi:Zn finger protein HypA/HybF involved in hydrogenase expression